MRVRFLVVEIDFEEAQAGLKAWHHIAHRAKRDVVEAFEELLEDYVQTGDHSLLDAFESEHAGCWAEEMAVRIRVDATELSRHLDILESLVDPDDRRWLDAAAEKITKHDVERISWDRFVRQVRFADRCARVPDQAHVGVPGALTALATVSELDEMRDALRAEQGPTTPYTPTAPTSHSEHLGHALRRSLSPFSSVGLGVWFNLLSEEEQTAITPSQMLKMPVGPWLHDVLDDTGGRIGLPYEIPFVFAREAQLESLLEAVRNIDLGDLSELVEDILGDEPGEASSEHVAAVAAGFQAQFERVRRRLLSEGEVALKQGDLFVCWEEKRGA